SWERIDTKVRPSARSGHRMAAWKQYLILFGGFVDTGARKTYLNDCWVFDTLDYKRSEIKSNPIRWPSPRSGFSFLHTQEGIVLYGGYVKRYVKGQRTQGVALDDVWFLSTTTGGNSPQPLEPAAWTWSKRRRVGYYPNPARSGTTMALWANRGMGVLFGGVTDTEADEETMESEFWKDLYAYQLQGTGRWLSLNLKRPKKRGGGGGGTAAKERKRKDAEDAARKRKEEEDAEERRYREEDDECSGEDEQYEEQEDEEERVRLQAIETARAEREAKIRATEKEQQQQMRDQHGSSISQPGSEARIPVSGPEKTVPPPGDHDNDDDPQNSVARERYNSMLAIQRNTFYIYGGIWENDNREYTLDDFYTLDLSKMERFNCLKECPIDAMEWNESDSDDDSGSDSGSDSSSSASSDDGQGTEGKAKDEATDAGAEKQQQEGVEYIVGVSDEEDDEPLARGDETPSAALQEVIVADEDGVEIVITQEQAEALRTQQAAEREELRKKAQAFMGVAKDSARTEEDVLSTPLPGETLRTF
ncbi:Kelch repeat-containing protein 3, partial [Tilletia horrida]